MIDFATAQALLADWTAPLGSETVALGAAHGRVLAESVTARQPAPRSDVSAMDGYALGGAVAAGAVLRVAGTSAAGAPFAGVLQPGEAARIFTGAAVPQGADRVAIQEDCSADANAGSVTVNAPPRPGQHIRRAGSDFAAGDVLLAPGTRLDPRALVAAAAGDRASLVVARRPQVAVLATGDELAAPGEAEREPHAIPESGGFGVAALARAWGAEVAAHRRLPDDPAALTAAATELLAAADVLVVIGGASVGERDFAKAMLAPLGLELAFAKVAIRPGKPVWLGRAAGRLVLGLPGNPTSAMVTARLFLAPLLARLQGQRAPEALAWRRLPLAAPLEPAGARETFARASWQADGLVPVASQDSGLQKALVAADWLIRCPAGQGALAAGSVVDALAF